MTSGQRTIKYLAMALAIFLTVSIIGGILGALGMVTGIFESDHVLSEMKEYQISEKVTSLDMEIEAAEFSIVTGEKLRVESNLKGLRVRVKNGKLVVEDESHPWFGGSGKGKLILYVPEGFAFETAEISTGAGEVRIDDLRSDKLRLELGAGTVRIDNLAIGSKTEIEGGAGKITVKNGCVQDLDFQMGVGEVNFTAEVLGNSRIHAGVGEVNMTLRGTKEDYEIHIDKGLGDVKVDGQSLGDGAAYGSGASKIELDTGVGSVYVDFD